MRSVLLAIFALGLACSPDPLTPAAVGDRGQHVYTVVANGPAATDQYNVYFGNLHAHTAYSDGSGTPAKAFAHARRAKLDFLAVTEHNHGRVSPKQGGPSHREPIGKRPSLYNGSQAFSLIRTAAAKTRDGVFVALYGQEWSTISSGNHMNVFDVPEVIDAGNGKVRDLVETWIPAHETSSGEDAFIQLNHPWSYPKSGQDPGREYGRDDWGSTSEWISALDAKAQLIEVMNGPSHSEHDGRRPATVNAREYLRMLAMGFHLAPTANQDNHFHTWGTASHARTGVIAKTLTKASILDALRARHVYASEDRNLAVIFVVDGHLLGDVVDNHPRGELKIELSIEDPDEPDATYDIDVYVGRIGAGTPRMIETYVWNGNGTGVIEDVKHDRPNQFFVFRVVQYADADGDHVEMDRLWTAPIWLNEGTAPGPSGSSFDVGKAVASKHSRVFHVSADCRDARRIKASNLVRGSDAVENRRMHQGCPR